MDPCKRTRNAAQDSSSILVSPTVFVLKNEASFLYVGVLMGS